MLTGSSAEAISKGYVAMLAEDLARSENVCGATKVLMASWRKRARYCFMSMFSFSVLCHDVVLQKQSSGRGLFARGARH